MQENLIGHWSRKAAQASSHAFIATQENELEVISVCNLSGEVIKETLGTRNRTVLAATLAQLNPLL